MDIRWGCPGGSDGRESTCNTGLEETWVGPGFHPWVGKIPWRRAWQPTLVFLPGEFHGQRNLVGSSPWDRKELDMTDRLSTQLKNTKCKLLLCCFYNVVYFFIFGCAASSLLNELFSGCGEQGLLSGCSAVFSLQWLLLLRAQAVGCAGFSSCEFWFPGFRARVQ